MKCSGKLEPRLMPISSEAYSLKRRKSRGEDMPFALLVGLLIPSAAVFL
jgi:hypothetical protein